MEVSIKPATHIYRHGRFRATITYRPENKDYCWRAKVGFMELRGEAKNIAACKRQIKSRIDKLLDALYGG